MLRNHVFCLKFSSISQIWTLFLFDFNEFVEERNTSHSVNLFRCPQLFCFTRKYPHDKSKTLIRYACFFVSFLVYCHRSEAKLFIIHFYCYRILPVNVSFRIQALGPWLSNRGHRSGVVRWPKALYTINHSKFNDKYWLSV